MSPAVLQPSDTASAGGEEGGTARSHDSRPLRQSSRVRVPSRRAEEMMLASSQGATEKASTATAAATTSSEQEKSRSGRKRAGEEKTDESPAPEASDDSQSGRGSEEEEEEEDDDDDQVYCVCQKGDTGTPMVFCGECEGWFHFKCVGLTKKAAESVLEFVCPPCNEKTGRSSKIEGMESGPAKDGEAGSSPASKRKRDEEDVTSKRSRRSSTSPPPPSLPPPPPSTVPRKPSISSSPSNSQDKVKPRKPSTSGLPGPFSSSSSSNTHSSSTSLNVLRTRSETLRKHAREQFVSLFVEMLSEARIADAKPRAEEYTRDFESALFESTGEAVPRATFRVAGKAYRDKLRSFLFNLKDKSNAALRSRIAGGTLAAQELSTLSSEELANDMMREEVERRRRENLEQSILKKEAAPVRKLTHKGEIDIEYENAQQRATVTETHEHHGKRQVAEKERDETEGKVGKITPQPSLQSSPAAARRVSQPIQSPVLPFDFSNVWQGSPPVDGSENGDEAGGSGEEQEEQESQRQDPQDGDDNGDADNFIDDFLGMPEGEREAVAQVSHLEESKEEEEKKSTDRWTGSINMPDEGAFCCRVRQVAGRTISDEEWDNLFPTEHSLIEGRLPSASAVPYLLQSRVAIRTEVVAFAGQAAWMPDMMRTAFKVNSEDANTHTFVRMVKYFQNKDRYGVLQPKKTARGKSVKDFYIAALPKEQNLPEWLTLLGSRDIAEGGRDQDMFLLVAVLFKPQPTSLPTPPVSAPTTSKSPLNPGSTPPTNIAGMLAPGSTTLQDLLRAVSGNRNPPNASPVPPSYSGVGMLSPTYDGGQPTQNAMASSAYSPGQAVPASSVQALSQLPKTQLEDVLTKNPSLVDDLLKTLNKPGVAGQTPPGPPPMRPPGVAHAPPHQPHHQTPPYGGGGAAYPNRNNYGGPSAMVQGYPSSGFPTQGYAPPQQQQQQQHHHQQPLQQRGHGPGPAGRGRGAPYGYRGGGNNGRDGRGQW